MRRVFAIFALALYVLALARPLAPYIEYGINKDFIATVLCINKDKPELKCDGKCYLAKQVKKASESDEQIPQTPKRLALENFPYAWYGKCCFESNLKTISKEVISTPYAFSVKTDYINNSTPPPEFV